MKMRGGAERCPEVVQNKTFGEGPKSPRAALQRSEVKFRQKMEFFGWETYWETLSEKQNFTKSRLRERENKTKSDVIYGKHTFSLRNMHRLFGRGRDKKVSARPPVVKIWWETLHEKQIFAICRCKRWAPKSADLIGKPHTPSDFWVFVLLSRGGLIFRKYMF